MRAQNLLTKEGSSDSGEPGFGVIGCRAVWFGGQIISMFSMDSVILFIHMCMVGVCMYACMYVCVGTFVYIGTYIHRYIHTSIHTYIHTYIHT